MKIYNLPRGAGKSTRMLYISEFKEIPILCFSREHKRHLLDSAKTYGINIPEPIVITEITSDKDIDIKDVLVDESLLALQKILNSKGLNMIGCTLSDEKNDTTLRDFNTNGYKDCGIEDFPENKMCQAEEIFPFETLEQCRTHYCKPIQKYISCKEFGKLDGMDGSCHWCREMTPLQFEMCWDESTVCNYERCGKTREEAIQLVEERKNKKCIQTSMFISANRTGTFDVKIFHDNDYATMELTFEEISSSLENILNSCNVRDVYIDMVRLGVLNVYIESVIMKKGDTVIHKIFPSDLQRNVFRIVKKHNV